MKGVEQFVDTASYAIEQCWPMIIIFVVIVTLLRITRIINNKEPFHFYQEFFSLISILYFLLLFYLLLSTEGASKGFNIMPFREMTRYTLWSRTFFYNVIGNIALFIPFGFIITWYLKSEKNFQIVIITFIISLTTEIIQYNIGRAFDIDDILLNILGSAIGYIIFRITKKIKENLPEFLKNNIFYNIVAVITMTIIIFIFAHVWGIKL